MSILPLRKTNKLNALEALLIDAIARALPDASSALLRDQVKLMNKVQRLDQNREIDLYHIKNGTPNFPDSKLFADRSDEFELARLKITDVDSSLTAMVTVSLVRGRLFCFEFDSPPGGLGPTQSLQIQVTRIADPGTSETPSLPSL